MDAAQIVDPVKAEHEMNLIRYKRALARRNFLKNVGLASAGIAAGAMIEGCSDGYKSSAGNIPEADVLNFALNLEYLEAEFYSVATTGNHLASSVTGGASTATGGAMAPLSAATAKIAAEIAQDEINHVKFLRGALGAAAVAEPNINLDALGIGYKSEAEFLTLARAFEDTGVSAYAGAATLLTGQNLQYAAQILATEAYHAGNIRLNVVQEGITVQKTDSMDIPPDMTHYFTVDSTNSLALTRTPSQVLMIVYATTSTGVSSGGFFPNGLNGNIKTT